MFEVFVFVFEVFVIVVFEDYVVVGGGAVVGVVLVDV